MTATKNLLDRLDNWSRKPRRNFTLRDDVRQYAVDDFAFAAQTIRDLAAERDALKSENRKLALQVMSSDREATEALAERDALQAKLDTIASHAQKISNSIIEGCGE